MLNGGSRSYKLPSDLDHVGVFWKRRSGYQTAWATPRHNCAHVHVRMGMEQFNHRPIPPHLQRRLTCGAGSHLFLTPWGAKEDVLSEVNINQYARRRARVPWHCDNKRLSGSLCEAEGHSEYESRTHGLVQTASSRDR